RAGERDVADALRHLDRRPVPGEGEADRATLADVATDFPARVIMIGEARGARENLGGEPLIGLARHEPGGHSPLRLDQSSVVSSVQVQRHSWHASLPIVW